MNAPNRQLDHLRADVAILEGPGRLLRERGKARRGATLEPAVATGAHRVAQQLVDQKTSADEGYGRCRCCQRPLARTGQPRRNAIDNGRAGTFVGVGGCWGLGIRSLRGPVPIRFGAGCGRRIDLRHFSHEAEAAPMDGANELLCRSIVAQSLACRLDPAAQGRIRDDPPFPYPLDDLLLADGALPILDQHDQEVKDLRLNGHAGTVVADLVRLGVDQICADPIRHWLPSGGTPPRLEWALRPALWLVIIDEIQEFSRNTPSRLQAPKSASDRLQVSVSQGGTGRHQDQPVTPNNVHGRRLNKTLGNDWRTGRWLAESRTSRRAFRPLTPFSAFSGGTV